MEISLFMGNKEFRIPKENIRNLIEPIGACYASDKITVDGLPVKYMYREAPIFDADSGWRFFSGTETQDYVDNPSNLMVFDVNTIANYDSSVIPYLSMPVGAELERLSGNEFVVIN
jgi:hypothetical protein